MLIALILVLVVTLSISFFCSLLEACVLSVGNADIANIEQKQPKVGAIWRGFKADLHKPLAVILILNTFAHTIGAAVSGAYFETLYGEGWLVVFSIAVSFIMIQWTEILPKTLGALYNRRLASLIAFPLQWLIRFLGPIVWFVQFLNRPFESKKGAPAPSTADEIRALAQSALISKQMGPQEVKIIAAGAELSGQTAEQIMIPPDEISRIEADMPIQEAMIKAHLDAHTRYPLCVGNDLNKTVGYINFKELVAVLRTNPDNATLRGIARPILYISSDESCSSVLKKLVEGRWHIALVRDAKGNTVGLLTMEDVVEELVGEIEDEFDRLPKTFHSLGDTVFAVGGGLCATELAQKLGIKIPDAAGSVSGWIAARLDRAPRPNDTVRVGDWTFTVRRIRRQRAYEVMATSNSR